MTNAKSESRVHSERALRVLIIEDNPPDVELTVATLKRAGFELSFQVVASPKAFQEELEQAEYDIILSDYNLRSWNAVDALRLLRDTGKDLPFILVTGSLGEESAVECIKQGMTDFVIKDRMARLPSVVRRSLGEKALRDEGKLAAEALKKSEEQYRFLFENNPHPMWVYDLETLGFLAVNDSAIYHYGYSRDEFLGMTVKDIRPPEDVPDFLANVSKRLEGFDAAGSWRHRKKDGTVIDVEIAGHPLPFGGRSAELILVTDITERKRAEEALRESEARYRVVAETATDAILTIDEESRILFVNPAAEKIFGHTRVEMLGQRLTMLMPEPLREIHRASLKRYVETRERHIPWEAVELPGLHKSGREIPLEISFGENSSSGKPFFTGILRDISERKKLEEQFRQSQKMEAVGRLAGGIAHDFNNLLTVITGYSGLVLDGLAGDTPERAQIEQIRLAGERAAALTRQLLAFSRRQVLQPQVLDLNDAVANIETMLRRLIGEDIDLVTIREPALGKARVDPGQLEQVIMNLAVNARDAMPRGGKLTMETANVELDTAYARGHISVTPGPHVMLAVSDTGHGMDAETRARIFEPFFTTKEAGKGTGLGLATVYGIVKQSGGNIWVYSEPSQGTTFKIYFPRVDQAAVAGEVPVRREESRGSETILLVEDEPAVRALACSVLESRGYKVLAAGNGEDALRVCEQHKGPLHLLLTDIVMPDMGGKVLAARLAPFHREMKVLYMSGYSDDAIRHHGILTAESAFLEKPFTPDGLTRKVREVLEGRGKLQAE